MNNKQDNKIVYRIISLLLIGSVLTIISIDVANKYYRQGLRIFTVNSPLLFPILVLITIFLCFIPELFSEYKLIKRNYFSKEKAEVIDKEKNNTQSKTIFYLFAFSIITMVYIFLLPKLHFIYGTSLYIFSIMFMMNEKDKFLNKTIKALLATGATIPVTYFIFQTIFGVVLP